VERDEGHGVDKDHGDRGCERDDDDDVERVSGLEHEDLDGKLDNVAKKNTDEPDRDKESEAVAASKGCEEDLVTARVNVIKRKFVDPTSKPKKKRTKKEKNLKEKNQKRKEPKKKRTKKEKNLKERKLNL